MARSRIGGSSGLLSGRVGDVIYSITRNSDGSYRQQLAYNDGIRENPNTEEQARARLTMATVERAMFTFRDLLGTGFEGVEKGNLSVSKFSEENYNLFKDDIKSAWELDMPEFVRCDLPTKGSTIPRDGEFMISKGSLRQISGFSGQAVTGNHVYLRVWVVSLANYTTLREVLWNTRIYIGDQIAGFRFGIGSNPAYSKLIWWTMWTDPGLSPNTYIDSTNFRQYLHFNSNVRFNVSYDQANNSIQLVTEDLKPFGIEDWGCRGYRRRAVKNGKICYSTQRMQERFVNPWTEYGWNDVPAVKDSWLI